MQRCFVGPATHVTKVESRCRRTLQALAEALAAPPPASQPEPRMQIPLQQFS